MIKYNIFLSLLFIFFLSSCSDKSDYDKYQSCLKKETSDTLSINATHDGYSHLKGRPMHTREWFLKKNKRIMQKYNLS